MSRARRSTLRHLRRLAATAVVGVACNGGYGDGDPVPQPARCASTTPMKGSAVWAPGDGGIGFQLIITITKTEPGTLAVAPSTEIVSSSTDGSGNLTTVVSVPPSESSVYLRLTLTCTAGQDQHTIAVQWSTPPVAGRTETVTVY